MKQLEIREFVSELNRLTEQEKGRLIRSLSRLDRAGLDLLWKAMR